MPKKPTKSSAPKMAKNLPANDKGAGAVKGGALIVPCVRTRPPTPRVRAL